MRYLTTSVAILAIAAASLARAQDGEGLRGALQAARPETSALQEAIAAHDGDVDAPAPALATEEELDQLIAPVALYPDSLLAQVLVAATYPLQVAKADQLITQSEDMSQEELGAALDRQSFDPSVLVLMSGFPTVIERMADDIDWTERLGNAVVAQDEDVLAAVQRMRAEADAAGNLSSNAAQVVEKEGDRIAIRPADPDVVYVPAYDPVRTYTTPNLAYTPSQTATSPIFGNPLVAGALAFGAALLVQELFNNDDDDDDHDNRERGWDNYWGRDRPIDWRDRQFYPRPSRERGNSWAYERDRYWDAQSRHWRDDDPERRQDRIELQRAFQADTAAGDRMRAVTRAREAEARSARAERGERAERAQAKAAADRARGASKARAARAETERATAEKATREKRAAVRDARAKDKAAVEKAAQAKRDAQAKAAAKADADKAAAEKTARAKPAAARDAQTKGTAKAGADKAATEKTARAKRDAQAKAGAKAGADKAAAEKTARAKRDAQAKAGAKAGADKAAAEKTARAKRVAARDARAKATAAKAVAARPKPAAAQPAKAKAKRQPQPQPERKQAANRKKCDPKKQECKK